MNQNNNTTSARVLRVACYERVSTEEQARHGFSIEAQIGTLEAWVHDHGHVLVGHFTDAGISGGSAIEKRPSMSRLMKAIQAGQIDLVVFTKLDRWFRSLKNYYKCQEILDHSHCAWQAIEEDYETLTAAGQFKVNIMLSVGEAERARTSERIRSVFEYKRAIGECIGFGGASTPYGYVLKDKHLEKDPETAPIIREMFDLALAATPFASAYKIIRSLHPDFPRSSNTFRRILASPLYAGIHNGIHGYCPAYITEEEHERLKRAGGTRSPVAGNVYLFTGLLHCPECGRTLVARPRPGAEMQIHYYYCNGARRDLKCSFRDSLRGDRVEALLTGLLFVDGEIVTDTIRPTSAAPKPAETAAQIEAKMKRLAETYTDGLIDRDAYKTKLTDLTEQLEAAKNTPETHSTPPMELIRQTVNGEIGDVYNLLTMPERKRFWQTILKSATISLDYRILDINFFEDSVT